LNARPLILIVACLLGALAPDAFAGKAAPDFSLRDLTNQTQTLSQYKGKVVLLNFWATWCGPCKVEMPHLEAMHEELGPTGLVVLGISADDARSASAVKPVAMSLGLKYPVLQDKDSAVVSQYNPSKTLPYNVLVDRAGNISSVFSGYNPGDEVKLKEAVVALLGQPG
jgi:peroxiredoxin